MQTFQSLSGSQVVNNSTEHTQSLKHTLQKGFQKYHNVHRKPNQDLILALDKDKSAL